MGKRYGKAHDNFSLQIKERIVVWIAGVFRLYFQFFCFRPVCSESLQERSHLLYVVLAERRQQGKAAKPPLVVR